MDKIKEIQQRAISEVSACQDLQRLDELRVEYLGKKGAITEQLKALGALDPEQRKALGAAVNQARDALTAAIAERKQMLEEAALEASLLRQRVDVTLPGRGEARGGLHPVTRAMHDTFYFADGRLLRTHTSPVQIRVMEKQDPPYRIIAPGKVYRSDSDQTHTPMFHQIEGLLVGEGVSMADLKGVLRTFVNAFFERSLPMRFRPSYFPFTEPSAEVDIAWDKNDGSEPGWLEILGCGMVHPNVLRACGVDTERYTGYAFGMGVERIAMLRYGVTDLRQFFENDLQFLRQFH